MARTAVPIVDLVIDGDNENPATTAIDVANGMVIAANGITTRLLIEVTNTFAGAKSVIFRAGVNPPGQRAGLGDLTVSMAQNDVDLYVLESARFCQQDGSINVDFTAATTGTIRAIRLPK